MASGIITTVKLEPFFQQFLRSHFEQENELVFCFPKDHDLLKNLNLLLTNQPDREPAHEYGAETFEIELYYLRHKDVRQKNWVSETGAKYYAKTVRDYYAMLFHDFYASRYRRFGHKETVYLWMEENGFDESAYDRIERDARRYRNRENQKNYRERTKLKNVNSSPLHRAYCPVGELA